ncbi:MAG: ammonium transporter [Chloroflexi bacterium]|nr:ammonium transporter [Chloroflexota bacterium]MYE38602.1 ammonium transporter [Chloroflexota bacterium]
MLAVVVPQSRNAALLRRFLPYVIAGLFAAAIMAGYNFAFAQEADPDANATDIGNLTTMIAAFLVFFMQAGFAFLGAGLIRSKNVTNYMTKSFMDFAIASLSFWAFGFAIMMGTSAAGIAGTDNFFLVDAGDDWSVYVSWMFQMVFAGTAATIVAGAVAERTKTQAYLAYSFIIGAIIYPLYGHWAWNDDGWLGALGNIGLPGAADYAGSGVVHAVGGFIALAGAVVVGPRIGKFNSDGTANQLPIHSVPFVIIGTFILFFGWFGFNIGSGSSIGLNAINTLLAGATGAVVALYITIIRTGQADILMACNGALAGLVGITAPVSYVDPWAAVVIGAIAAPIMMGSVWAIENILKIDDPVSAISVHGTCGLWGLLAIGIFANGNNDVNGLVGGEGLQIVSQLISMGVVLAWALVTGFAMFLLLKFTMGVRASREEEEQGMDLAEHDQPAYDYLSSPQ